MARIGLIGGISWESTASYYRLLNELTVERHGAWHQPSVIVDSLNFFDLVQLQRADDWASAGAMVADSARRLERGGAEVLGICANTMHKNFDDVRRAVSIPVVDIREAVAAEVKALGYDSLALLGTKYLMDGEFYSAAIERLGVRVVKPDEAQGHELQTMIYEELTQGVVTETSRARFLEIASDCRARGGDVVGLCCTEFGLLVDEANAPWPYVDSTVAHVKALLNF